MRTPPATPQLQNTRLGAGHAADAAEEACLINRAEAAYLPAPWTNSPGLYTADPTATPTATPQPQQEPQQQHLRSVRLLKKSAKIRSVVQRFHPRQRALNLTPQIQNTCLGAGHAADAAEEVRQDPVGGGAAAQQPHEPLRDHGVPRGHPLRDRGLLAHGRDPQDQAHPPGVQEV